MRSVRPPFPRLVLAYRRLCAAPRAIVLTAAALSVGCLSNQPSVAVDPQDRRHGVIQRLERWITEERYQEVIQHIDYRRRQAELFLPEELDFIHAEAVSGIVADLRAAIAAEDYRIALIHYHSLMTLGEAGRVPEWSRERLQLEHAEQLLSRGNRVVALHIFLRIPHFDRVEEQVIRRYLDVAIEDGDRLVVQRIADLLQRRGLEDNARVEEILTQTVTPSAMLSGTATVWVDRGIKVERGIGSPDRVIGSSFFIDRRGYLITNYHVIASEVDPTYEGYSRLFIRISDDPTLRIPAQVVGYDRIFDVALLKVELEPEFVFAFNGARELPPGSPIFALGSPGGLANTMTSGIVSATNRRFFQLGAGLQIDVPVNPGNSGGPLIDGEGNLVAVVFAGIEQFEGVNFAIPSYWIHKFLPSLYERGEVIHPWIGIALHEDGANLQIQYVVPQSPAEQAGLMAGDVIRSIEGWTPTSILDAQDIILDLAPDSLVTLEWDRAGESLRGYIHLVKRPFSPLEDVVLADDYYDQLFVPLFGMEIDEIRRLPWQRDYVVTHIYQGSIADESGMSIQDPFSLFDWQVDLEQRAVFIRIAIRRRTVGFTETGLILASSLEPNNFL